MPTLFALALGVIVFGLGLYGKISPGAAAAACIAGILTAMSVNIFRSLVKSRDIFSAPVLFCLAAAGAVAVNRHYEAIAVVILYHASAGLFPWWVAHALKTVRGVSVATAGKPPSAGQRALTRINALWTPVLIAAAILIILLSYAATGSFFTWFTQALVCLIAASPIIYAEDTLLVPETAIRLRTVSAVLQLTAKLIILPLCLLLVVSPLIAMLGDTAAKLAATLLCIRKGSYEKLD